MFDPLFDARDPIFQALASIRKTPHIAPLPVSQWIAASALQKGIRRGDANLALSAAATLLHSNSEKLWQRLAGIAFEDIGLASVETIRLAMAVSSGKTLRRQFGGDWPVGSLLIERMCAAPKSRAADDLFISISHHRELDALRSSLARENLSEHLSRVEGRGALLGASLAALHATSVRWTGRVSGRAANPNALFAAMKSAGIDPQIVDLAEQGFRRTREPLPILLPLVSRARPWGKLPVANDDLPPVTIGRNDIPTFCFDAFSYEGKAALARFLRRRTATGDWLRKHVPAERRMSVLAGGLFRVEGGLVRQRVEWPCATTLRRMADEGYHGLKLSDPATLLDMIRADLPTLDQERADVH